MYSSAQKKLIRKSLDRIFRSNGFAQAPQLRNFLKFVVDKTLANQSGEIKGYTIGVEALGRNVEFDPHTDPIVRVMAGRLRQALKNYHAENSEPLNVSINIPKGTYVPQFKFVALNAPPKKTGIFKLGLFQTALLATIVAGFALWAVGYSDLKTIAPRAIVSTNDINSARINVSLRINEDELPQWFSAQEAVAGLVTAFSKFNEFEILQVASDNTKIGSENTFADYHFSVLIARAGTSQDIRAFTRLKRLSDGVIVWSQAIAIAKPVGQIGIDASKLAGRTISPLLSPYGIIYADIINRKSVPKHLECINRFYAYFAMESQNKYANARQCIETAIQNGSASSSIYAMQTFLQIEVYRKKIQGYDSTPLAAAKISANKAIELGPQNARAHQAQFGVFKVSRHEKMAIDAAKMALSLNPYDSDIIGDFAAFLVSIGKFDQAKPLLDQAMSYNPSLPVWLEFYAFLHAELTGDFARADMSAAQINPDASPLAAIAIVLAAHRNQNESRAGKAYQSLVAQEKDFDADPVAPLLRRGFSQDIADKIAAVLRAVKPGS